MKQVSTYISNVMMDFRQCSMWSKIALIGGALGCCLLVRNLLVKYNRKYKGIPNGLIGIPYFGSLFTMGYYGSKFNSDILPSYGDICSYDVGKQEFIVLNNVRLVHSVFASEYCVNRPQMLANIFFNSNLCPH